jgi:hypothetical protein
MIWPIFRDATGDAAGEANATHPSRDLSEYGKPIRDPSSAAVRRLGSTARPEAYALEVTDRILPEHRRQPFRRSPVRGDPNPAESRR